MRLNYCYENKMLCFHLLIIFVNKYLHKEKVKIYACL